jgi:hypothetical protein
MSVEELLTWVQSFAVEEGPDQIENGGKYGAQHHFLPEAVRLRNLVYAATDPSILSQMPPAYQTDRAQTALEGLASQLDEAAALAVGLFYSIPAQGNGAAGTTASASSGATIRRPGASVTGAMTALPRKP